MFRGQASGGTGHTKAARVSYDPAKLGYRQLVDYFWRPIDPTVKDRQFCDVGTQYRSAIYWQNEAERKIAETSHDAVPKSGKLPQVFTEIAAASAFYLCRGISPGLLQENPDPLCLLSQKLRQGCPDA